MDFITGERFIKLGDFVYMPERVSDYHLPNTFNVSALREVNTVYTHTMYARELLNIIRKLDHKFVLVTHNCDEKVDDSYNIPDNVVQWFSQNVAVRHPRLQSLPIGLENYKWTIKVHKQEIMLKKLSTEKQRRNLVYVNHNIATNVKEREKPYLLLAGKPWVTAVWGKNGHHFEKYIDDVYHHRFVICPAGNGIDSVRLWETLYMGSIPIVKKSINTEFYEDLPICFVNDWEDITIDFLAHEVHRILTTVWNTEKLQFEYWKSKIKSYDK
jgi:hypothetical protein